MKKRNQKKQNKAKRDELYTSDSHSFRNDRVCGKIPCPKERKQDKWKNSEKRGLWLAKNLASCEFGENVFGN